MRNITKSQSKLLVVLIMAIVLASPCLGQLKDDLPNDFDQLIEMKSGLLQRFSELEKSGAKEQAIESLRKIVDIHRKALSVATETNRGKELINQLQKVFVNDGEYLSDQLFARSEFTASAALRKELEDLLARFVGPTHNGTQIMRWKAVTAAKLSTASKELQVAYQEAVGSKAKAAQAMQNGQADIAAQVYTKLIEAEVAVLGEEHTDVATDLNELGRAQMSAGKNVDAEKSYLRGLKAREAATGKDLQYATISFNLGRLYQETNRFEEAEVRYVTAAKIEEPILGSSNKSFQMTLGQLAALYQKSGNTAKLMVIRQRIAAADPLNTVMSHLPQGTFAAAMIEPSKLPMDPGLALLPFEMLKASGEESLGFNPLDVEAAVVFATLPLDDSPNFGVSFRLRAGVDASFPWEAGSMSIDFEGVQYLKEASGGPNAMCAKEFDDRVVVLGTEEAVRQCIKNAAETPVMEMLKADRQKGQVIGAANLVLARPVLQSVIAQAPPAPPAIENLKSLPDQLDSVQVRLNISSGIKLSLSINATDEAAAQRTAAAITQALNVGLQTAVQGMQAELEGDSPVQVATRSYVQRIASSYIGKLQPKIAEKSLTIEIDGIEQTYGPVAVALLLPAVQAARDAARRAQDMNSLRQIGLAMLNYHDAHGTLPAQASFDKNGKPLLSWRVHLLPFLEQQALYEQFHLDEPWDSDHNLPLAEQMPSVFRNQALNDNKKTVLMSFFGAGTFLDGKKGLTFKDFTDGSSNTLMVAEANTDEAVEWTKPADLNFDEADPLKGLGAIRPEGFQAVFVDGAVRMIPANIDIEILRRLILRNDGQVIGDF